jgi:hypothetical protein
MPTHFHAVVWLDHTQARIFHIGLTSSEAVTLHPHLPTKHLHHKADSIGSGHAGLAKDFLEQVASNLNDAGEILIIGPAGAKTELAKFIHIHHPAIGRRIVAVETTDHPTDPQIIAYAKRHFKMPPARVATGVTYD